jgi:hypothetical protein
MASSDCIHAGDSNSQGQVWCAKKSTCLRWRRILVQTTKRNRDVK